MKMVGIFRGLVAACFVFLLGACGGTTDTSCTGSKPAEYLITNYITTLVRYEKPLEVGLTELPKSLAANESPAWNRFSIELKATYQLYQVKALPQLRFSLFEIAMACSPRGPAGKQNLTKISITSADDFSDKYPAGSELVPLFESIDHGAIKLTLLLVNSPAPLSLKLKLLESPQFARQNFNVQITLDDGSNYILNTGDVYFTLP